MASKARDVSSDAAITLDRCPHCDSWVIISDGTCVSCGGDTTGSADDAAVGRHEGRWDGTPPDQVAAIEKRNNAVARRYVGAFASLALLGVLSVTAVPSLKVMNGNSQAAVQANELVESLQHARALAAEYRQPVRICPLAEREGTQTCGHHATAWTQGWIVYVDGTRDGQLDTRARPCTGEAASGDCIERIQRPDTSGLTLTASPSLGNQITFRPSGRPEQRGAISVCSSLAGVRPRVISLSATGRVGAAAGATSHRCASESAG